MSELTLSSQSDVFKDIPHERVGILPWAEPQSFKLDNTDDQARAQELVREGAIDRVIDPVAELATAIFEMEHPEQKGDVDTTTEYVESVLEDGEKFGTWWYMPWMRTIARYPDKDVHQALRTFRFMDLISQKDQKEILLQAKVFFAGLSVGSKAVETCVENGIGGTVIFADYDTIDPTNTGRISATNLSVGEPKISWLAKKVSEKDPWIKQIHLPEGITPDNLTDELVPDVIVEEVDSLAVKAMVRLWAEKHGVPLIMAADIHDKSVIDVERYDLADRKALPFQGRIKHDDVVAISRGGLSEAENTKWMLKHTGMRDLSVRMMRSAMEKGTRLGGLPQLGTTTSLGGAEITFAVREILLGNELSSGRYRSSPREVFGLGNEYSVLEAGKTVIDLAGHMKRLKARSSESSSS